MRPNREIPPTRAKRWDGAIAPSIRVIDRFPKQFELFPQEVDVEKAAKHVGKVEREIRDSKIRMFISNPYAI